MHRHILNTIVTRGVSTFLNFLIALIIARHAGPAVKGDVTLLVTTIWFIVFFSDILGGQVLVYIMPRSKPEMLIGPAYVWSCLVAVVAFAVLFTTHLLPASFIAPVAVISWLSALMGIHQTILLSRQQITASNALSLFPLALQTIGVVVCFYSLDIHDARAYILATLFSHGITTLVGIFLLRKAIGLVSWTSLHLSHELRQLFQYGVSYQAVEILQLLNLRYYFFQLGLQQGNRYLGIYSIGISILEAVWIIPRSISTVHYVHTSNSSVLHREAERTAKLLLIGLSLSGLALVAIWLVPSEAYTTVFGHGFHEVRHSIRYLFPGIFIYNFWIIISSFYLGTGNYKPLIISNLAGVISLAFFSHLLIPKYVMSGAGLAATLSFTAAGVSLAIMFTRSYHIPWGSYLNSASLATAWQQLKEQFNGTKR